MKPVFAVMVTYRRFDYFKRTYESLMATLPPMSRIFIVVNDDHQNAPEYAEFFKTMVEPFYGREASEEWPVLVDMLFTGKNLGWAGAMNWAMDIRRDFLNRYEYVLESNNDVTYEPDWYERARAIMGAHPEIGILGLWGHTAHAVRTTMPDILIKDDMPAVSWFMRSNDLREFLPFPEHGPCNTYGGNGEDTGFVKKVQDMGRWVACPTRDLSHHMDGYGPVGGGVNKAYE